MKKIMMILLAILAINQAAEAQAFYKKFKPSTANVGYKKVRGAKEQCIQELRYADTNVVGNGVLNLSRNTYYTYTGSRGNNGITKSFNFFPNLDLVVTNFDSARSPVDFNTGADSSLILQNFDASDRLLKTVTLVYNMGVLDTQSVLLYKYSGTNTVADSVSTIIPMQGSTPSSIVVNQISANRVDSSTVFADLFGGGLAPLFFSKFLYDANGNTISTTEIFSVFGFGQVTRSTYSYLSNNLLDSITSFEGPSVPALKITQTVGIDYNGTFTAGNWTSRDSVARIDGLVSFKLDAAKNMIENVGYDVDTVGVATKSDSTLLSYTANNNLLTSKQWGSNLSGSAWQATDSARFIYKPIIQASTNTFNSIQSLSILPTIVINTAFVHYQTTHMQKAVLTVTNAAGAVLYTQNLSTLNGNTIVPVDVSNFANGMYHASIVTEDGSKANIRFVK
jgi:hypothetical protein